MSHAAVGSHDYRPEQHAPDPVFSHGDPTPPGKVAIWLFLASEIMFFIGILGSYLILRSGAPTMFAKHGEALSKNLAGINTLVLIFSSLTMALSVDAAQKGNRSKLSLYLALTLLCAFGFTGIKYVEYKDKFLHYSLVAVDPADGKPYVYDGHSHHIVHKGDAKIELHGYRAPLVQGENVNLVSHADVKERSADKQERDFVIPMEKVSAYTNHGPWKNNFYGSYFALTGVHMLHVFGGMIPMVILLIQSLRSRILAATTEYVGLYWHFVDLVWIFLFPLLYLI